MRDMVILGIAGWGLFGVAMLCDLLAQHKIIPRRLAPGAARDLFFSRFELWWRTVLPGCFVGLAIFWLLLRFVLPQDIETLRNIRNTVSEAAALIFGLTILGYKKSYPFISEEKAKDAGEKLGGKKTQNGE